MKKKNEDYGANDDPFANFRTLGALGFLVRMWDKLSSLRTYIENVRDLDDFLGQYAVETYFITSRANTAGELALSQSKKWLEKYWLNAPHSSVIRVEKASQKRQIIDTLKIKFSLDDYGPTVEECNGINGHKAFILDRPYNREYNQPRVYSVKEFLDIMRASL